MAIGNMDLYRALKEAGASDEAASEAAKSVAGHLPRFWSLTGTLVVLVALVLGMVWLQLQSMQRLAALEERVTQQHAEVLRQFEALRRDQSPGGQ
jgi:hypothetical protein